MKNHAFNTTIAKKVGVNSAVILNNIVFWIDKNKANNEHFHDGYYWTYNSHKAFSEIFDYLSESQIRTAIEKLISVGFIQTGNFNKKNYDRTTWYALTDYYHEFINNSICENSQLHLRKIANAFEKNLRPIPDINTDIKSNINTDIISETITDNIIPNGIGEEVSNKEVKSKLFNPKQLNAIYSKNSSSLPTFKEILRKNLIEHSTRENERRKELLLFQFSIDTANEEIAIKADKKFYLKEYALACKISREHSIDDIDLAVDFCLNSKFWTDNYSGLNQFGKLLAKALKADEND